MSSAEQRIQRLEDLESIRHLKHYYFCHCVDEGIAGDEQAAEKIASRLTDDVVLDFTRMPLFEGKQAVLEFLAGVVPDVISWAQHRVVNDVIEVDGDRASGVWYVDCPVVYREGKLPGLEGNCLVAGRYEEEHRRVDGVWKFSRIVALVDVQSSSEVNWRDAEWRRSNRDEGASA